MPTRNDYFPKHVQLAAQTSERENGILACVTLAQWAHESGYGRYQLGANNPFGIKWPPGSGLGFVVRRTWEVIRGKKVTVDARFAAFPTIEAAFRFHGRMLANPKGYYRHALPYRKAWREYINAIAPVYATDPAYARLLISIVERWKLYELNLPPAPRPDAASLFPGY